MWVTKELIPIDSHSMEIKMEVSGNQQLFGSFC